VHEECNKATTWFCNYVVEHVQVNMLIDCYLRSFEQYFSYIHDDNKCIYHDVPYVAFAVLLLFSHELHLVSVQVGKKYLTKVISLKR
jgi:hypothetical protein